MLSKNDHRMPIFIAATMRMKSNLWPRYLRSNSVLHYRSKIGTIDYARVMDIIQLYRAPGTIQMESRALPKKSHKQSDEGSELANKKVVESFSNAINSKSSGLNQTTSAIQNNESNGQVTKDLVLRELSPAASRLDLEMRNQISSARGMTVEISTLRDLMPKLRKEIQTYTVNECQLVKELENKLPSCQEHKDIRLNLVLDEIHRLRENRRRTLTRLTESIVKVVGSRLVRCRRNLLGQKDS
jgi:hypothetical protein